MKTINKFYKDKEYGSSEIYKIVCEGTMYPGRIPCVTYQNIELLTAHTVASEAFYERFKEIEPRINPKYIHHFSLNFQITSDIEGRGDEETWQLYAAARSKVEEIVEQGKAQATSPYCLEWVDAEEFDNVHGLTEQS